MDELHVPVWERRRDKTGSFLRPGSLVRLAARLAWAYLTLLVRLARRLPEVDAVIIGYIGQADMLILAPLARLWRRPVIFNTLVTLTDTLVEDRGLVRPGTLPAWLLGAIDRLALRLADRVLVDTPENGAYLIERLGADPKRIVQLDVGADDRLFTPRKAVQERPTAPLQVLFFGKYTPLHGVETILRAAALLRDEPVHFTLIGTGQLAREMRALAAELRLPAVTFVEWVPYESLPEEIARADVVLGIFGDTEKAARVVPNKVFQAMAMGAAIVTLDSPAIRRVLRDEESALLVPADDPEALASAIRRLVDPALRARLGAAARDRFVATGSIAALAERLDQLLHPLVTSAAERRPEREWR